jgi:hypothetical protein
MVKLTNELKNEILEKFKNGSKTGEIMNQYKLSRSTVQRLKNEIYEDNNTYVSSKDGKDDQKDVDDLLNDLNDIKKTDIKKTDIKKTDIKINERLIEDEIIKPVQRDSTFENIHGKMDIINKLDLFGEKTSHKPVQYNQPVQNHSIQAPKQNITVNATEKDYIQKKNLISKVKRFVQSFPVELNNITGGNSQLFIHRLVELECHQLEQLITNIQFEINQPKVSQLFNTIFFTTLNQVENLSGSFGYNVNGMTANLQKNEECMSALKELNCMYDISGVSTPEMRLLICVMMTGMTCYNTNKISQTIDEHLEKPISEDIQDKFKNL